MFKISRVSKAARWELADFLFIGLAGTLLHFAYDRSGGNTVVGIFSPINESVWEHLKLLYYPAVLFGAVEYIFLRRRTASLMTAKALGIILGMLFTVAAFYSYTALVGRNILWVDVVIFFLSALLAAYCSYIWRDSFSGNIAGFNVLLILFGLFAAFTFFIPDFFIFNEH